MLHQPISTSSFLAAASPSTSTVMPCHTFCTAVVTPSSLVITADNPVHRLVLLKKNVNRQTQASQVVLIIYYTVDPYVVQTNRPIPKPTSHYRVVLFQYIYMANPNMLLKDNRTILYHMLYSVLTKHI